MPTDSHVPNASTYANAAFLNLRIVIETLFYAYYMIDEMLYFTRSGCISLALT